MQINLRSSHHDRVTAIRPKQDRMGLYITYRTYARVMRDICPHRITHRCAIPGCLDGEPCGDRPDCACSISGLCPGGVPGGLRLDFDADRIHLMDKDFLPLQPGFQEAAR